jgi:hypothetical protein
MTKVRTRVHKPTRAETPKTVYDRNEAKRELQEIIDKECTCLRMVCECDWEDDYEDVGVSEEG